MATGWIAWAEDLPGANTQGKTVDEVRENLQEAVELVLESGRIEGLEELRDCSDVAFREEIEVVVPVVHGEVGRGWEKLRAAGRRRERKGHEGDSEGSVRETGRPGDG
jgi:predicted RNase H-like HicB family nuclease